MRDAPLYVQFLREHPCVRCGASDPVVLEFNHLDPGAKSGNICDMVHFRVSINGLRQEMAKCEVLCANCHQRHTTRVRLAHYKLSGGPGVLEFASPRTAADRRNIRIVRERLATAACVDCGVADPLVLQFDHRGVKNERHCIARTEWVQLPATGG
jgi:hypothetical protein